MWNILEGNYHLYLPLQVNEWLADNHGFLVLQSRMKTLVGEPDLLYTLQWWMRKILPKTSLKTLLLSLSCSVCSESLAVEEDDVDSSRWIRINTLSSVSAEPWETHFADTSRPFWHLKVNRILGFCRLQSFPDSPKSFLIIPVTFFYYFLQKMLSKQDITMLVGF